MNTTCKILLIPFVNFLLGSSFEQCIAAQPAPQELKGTIQLEKPEIINAAAMRIDEGVIIVTNGYPLTIVVGDLIIEGAATIRSFPDEVLSKAPQKPDVAQSGIPGASFNPGPDSEGQGSAQNGNSGGPGSAGMAGKPAVSGKDAGPIAIVVTGDASGELQILNDGAVGGDGGNGGDGGVGGSGQQGGRAVPNMHLGIAMGCEKGPGHGGNGGAGGAGGNGGNGANGGNGGDVKIGVYGNVSGFRITKCSLDGGRPGAGGVGGKGGAGGFPGFGGRGAPGCEGRIQERKGSAGQAGNSGIAGQPGQVGKSGQHNLEGQPFFRLQAR